jgi:hypothetical protein
MRATISSVEMAEGSFGADTFIGSAANNFLKAPAVAITSREGEATIAYSAVSMTTSSTEEMERIGSTAETAQTRASWVKPSSTARRRAGARAARTP